MDNPVIYSLVGIVTLILIIIATLYGAGENKKQGVKTKQQKKAEILKEYKLELKKVLEPLKNNQQELMAKKTALLKRFSDELSRNIFFYKEENREIIEELTKQ